VVEAATHGRPVIGSDDPAVAEVVERLGAGAIVPAGNSAALLVELRRLLGDDELVASIAAHSREAVSAHTITAVTAATRAVYQRVLGDLG
jgi:glycosyltransferase involved in cell wall biosynthesis